VQGYRALYERYQGEAPRAGNPPAFGDVINAQQTLVTNVQSYVTALGALWQSVTDVADLLQTDDLFQIGGDKVPLQDVAPLPDLGQLKQLPCCHPCAAPDASIKSDNGAWPAAVPATEDRPTPRPNEGKE